MLVVLQVPALETGMNAPALQLLLLLVVLMVAVQVRAGDELGLSNKGRSMVRYSFHVCHGQALAGDTTADGKEEGASFVCGMGCTTARWPQIS